MNSASRRRSTHISHTSPDQELLLELDTARNDLIHALSEIEHMQGLTEEYCCTIDDLKERLYEFESELDRKDAEIERLTRASSKERYEETREASNRRSTAKRSSCKSSMEFSIESACLELDEHFENTAWDDRSPSPTQSSDNRKNNRGIRTLFTRRSNINEQSNVQIPEDNDGLTKIEISQSDSHLPPSSGGWFKKKGNVNENEAVLLRQLHVLQDDKNREIKELNLKLQQRENAISTLESALSTKEETMKLMQDEFDAEFGKGRGIFRSRSRGRGRGLLGGGQTDRPPKQGGFKSLRGGSIENASADKHKPKKKKKKRGLLSNHVQADFDLEELDNLRS